MEKETHEWIKSQILTCMATTKESFSVQSIQTDHRMKLAELWGIKEGMKILEIGCGQGDTTAVLAYFVGENGHVQGIDIADGSYGSPISIGEAGRFLMDSPLGSRITMSYNMDLLDPHVTFDDDAFDAIVLSHCSWYFRSTEELSQLLKKVRPYGKKLYFSEWDPCIRMLEQYPHLLAAMIQSEVGCYIQDELSNIRTLFTPTELKSIVTSAGWSVTNEYSVFSEAMQDGHWEVDRVISVFGKHETVSKLPMPEKMKALVCSQVDLMKEAVRHRPILPLSTFVFIGD